jgi:transcription elongation factor Elf1
MTIMCPNCGAVQSVYEIKVIDPDDSKVKSLLVCKGCTQFIQRVVKE